MEGFIYILIHYFTFSYDSLSSLSCTSLSCSSLSNPSLSCSSLSSTFQLSTNESWNLIDICKNKDPTQIYSFLLQRFSKILPLDFLLCLPLFFPNHIYFNKFFFLSEINNNAFLNDSQKLRFEILFSKIQRIYRAFCRFIYLYKLKKATVCTDHDLFFNLLDITKKTTFLLFREKSIYYFSIRDLIFIFENALMKHNTYFDLEIHTPKNPYTNLPFTELNLYNIKFHLNEMNRDIPLVIQIFFQERFCVYQMKIHYYHILLRLSIKRYIMNPNNFHSDLLTNIKIMIRNHPYTIRWRIHMKFPTETLIQTMRPYLYLYYVIKYGQLNDSQFFFYSSLLDNSLNSFWDFNPFFGQKKKKNIIYKNPFSKPLIKTEQSPINDEFHDQYFSISVKDL